MLVDYTHRPRSAIKEESEPLLPVSEGRKVDIPVLRAAARFAGERAEKRWYENYPYNNVSPGHELGDVLASVRSLMNRFLPIQNARNEDFLRAVVESFDDQTYGRCMQWLSAYQYAFGRGLWIAPVWNPAKQAISIPTLSKLDYKATLVRGLLAQEPTLRGEIRDSLQYRYMLSTAAAIHSGMRPAVTAGYAREYPLTEIRAALMLCAGPMHTDWRTVPLEKLFYDYAYSVFDENRVVQRRFYDEIEYARGFPYPLENVRMAITSMSFEAVPCIIPVMPCGDLIGSLVRRRYALTSSDVAFVPFILGASAVISYSKARAYVTLSESKPPIPVEEPKHHIVFDRDTALPGVQLQTEFFDKAMPGAEAFPESVRAFRIGNASPRYVPYFIGFDPQDMQRYILIPSTKRAAALLRRVYGIPEGSALAPVPADMQGLLDFHTDSFGFDIEFYMPVFVYRGLIDFQAFCTGNEPRDEQNCSLDELFHRILI